MHPNGKTAFTRPISITSQFPFCGLPLRLDTYAGCGFRCSYCFARYRGGATFGDNIRPANPETIKRIFHLAIDLRRFPTGVIAQCLRRRMPIHFGGMSDGFQPAEARYRVTEAVLRVLARYSYPTVISTRGSLIGEGLYLDLLKSIGPVVAQFSFSTTRKQIASKVEPFSNVSGCGPQNHGAPSWCWHCSNLPLAAIHPGYKRAAARVHVKDCFRRSPTRCARTLETAL